MVLCSVRGCHTSHSYQSYIPALLCYSRIFLFYILSSNTEAGRIDTNVTFCCLSQGNRLYSVEGVFFSDGYNLHCNQMLGELGIPASYKWQVNFISLSNVSPCRVWVFFQATNILLQKSVFRLKYTACTGQAWFKPSDYHQPCSGTINDFLFICDGLYLKRFNLTPWWST